MSWEKVKLEDLYDVHNGLSKGGKFFGSGYPFITFSTVFNNFFLPDEITDYVQSTEKEQASYSVLRGDVFVTRTSETSDELGMSCVALKDYPNTTYNGFTKRMRPKDNSRVHPEYIGYYMRMPSFRAEFKAFSTMTTRASLRNEDLLSLHINLPPYQDQVKIAQILRNYDHLIENNRKQIKLLEEAAQRLYKEWFVDLRFPGYENTPIVDGVPEGWHLAKLSDVATVNAQSISKQYSYEFVDYVDLSAVSNGHIEATTRFSIQEAPGRAKRVASDGDIIWGMVRPNLKSYALVLHPTETNIFSTGFAVLSAKKIPFSFLYCHVTTDNFVSYLINCTNGAAYPAVKPIHFEDATLLVPSDDILNQFHRIAEPMYRKIEVLEKQLFQAKEARDRLLPKLMNGEIEVL